MKSITLIFILSLGAVFPVRAVSASSSTKGMQDPFTDCQTLVDVAGELKSLQDFKRISVCIDKRDQEIVGIRYEVPNEKTDKNLKKFTLAQLETPRGAVFDTNYGSPTFLLRTGELLDPTDGVGAVENSKPEMKPDSVKFDPLHGGWVVLSYLYEWRHGTDLYKHLQMYLRQNEKGEWRLFTVDQEKKPFSYIYCKQKYRGIESADPIFDSEKGKALFDQLARDASEAKH